MKPAANASPSSAVVIGAGVSGMTGALILAMKGWKVTLVEKAPRPGVTMRGFSRKGVYFESGLHFAGELAEQGLLRAYLRYLGMDTLEFADFDPHTFETFAFGDGSAIEVPAAYESYRETLMNAFPEEKDGIAAYLAEVRDAYDASLLHNYRGPFSFSGEWETRWLQPLDEFLSAYVSDARLRDILTAAGWLYGVSPGRVPFLLHARVAGSHFASVRTFKGGGLALVRAFEKRLRETGVTVRCNSGVSRILLSAASGPEGVELENGDKVEGKLVIHTGHPSSLIGMAPEGTFRPIYANRLRGLNDTVSGHLLFFAAKGRPERLRGKNLYLYPRDASFAGMFRPGSQPSNGPFYLLASPQEQREGDEPVTAVTAVTLNDPGEYRRFYGEKRGRRSPEYAALKKDRLGRMAEAIARACPEASDMTLLEGATPLTLRDWLGTPDSGVYGAAHTTEQINPAPVTRAPNLYLAGQGVVAPGLMGAVISAILTCGIIIGYESLIGEVTACR